MRGRFLPIRGTNNLVREQHGALVGSIPALLTMTILSEI